MSSVRVRAALVAARITVPWKPARRILVVLEITSQARRLRAAARGQTQQGVWIGPCSPQCRCGGGM